MSFCLEKIFYPDYQFGNKNSVKHKRFENRSVYTAKKLGKNYKKGKETYTC